MRYKEIVIAAEDLECDKRTHLGYWCSNTYNFNRVYLETRRKNEDG
jgi:hypothetical protein